MTAGEFISRHPEFRQAGATLITAALANAALFVSADVYGARYDLAVEYKACVLLSSGQYGQLQPAPNTSTVGDYQKLFDELRKLNPIRGMVT